MAITFVASWSSASATNSNQFGINKPAGVAAGDVLLAFVGLKLSAGQGQITVTPPPGWTKLSDSYVSDSQWASHQLTVLQRVALASDPASWIGNISTTVDIQVRAIVAYRGATGVVASNYRGANVATTIPTGTATNPASNNWRITAGCYNSGSTDWSLETTEVTERVYRGVEQDGDPHFGVELDVWDSGGAVASGSQSRTITRGATWNACVSWIGILDAADVTASGSLAFAAPLPDASMAAEQGYTGTMAGALPLPTVDGWPGISTPPEGPLGVLITPVVDFAATHHPFGTLNAVVVPVMELVGETRLFGARVVNVEAEDRTVAVVLVGADDTE